MMNIKAIFSFLLSGLILFVFAACSNDDTINDLPAAEVQSEPEEILNDDERIALKEDFAKVLSEVIYENQDVRAFLKKEAMKKFDKNYDILYMNVKDSLIGNKTFYDVLAAKSSDLFLSKVEKQMPLLNILFPELPIFNLKPENYSVEDHELPVAVSGMTSNKLFFNGEETDVLNKNEVPDFYVLVVNENKRVVVNKETRSCGGPCYKFKHPEYDGVKGTKSTRSFTINEQKMIEAYMHFYADDASVHSKAFQRDYIYYGITPEKQSGTLNRSVSEYLYYIEVNPISYFRIADDPAPEDEKLPKNYDPVVKKKKTDRDKKDFTDDELISELWTDGAYNFIFEVVHSNNGTTPLSYPIPATPSDLWDFHLEREYRHSTYFGHHSNYAYTIDPHKFTSKKYYLPNPISIGNWNIGEEALERYVEVIEEDAKSEITISYTQAFSHAITNKFNGDTKLELGLGNTNKDKSETKFSYESSTTNSISDKTDISYKRWGESDKLGRICIKFYEPIIQRIKRNRHSKQHPRTIEYKEYNNGSVGFGIRVF